MAACKSSPVASVFYSCSFSSSSSALVCFSGSSITSAVVGGGFSSLIWKSIRGSIPFSSSYALSDATSFFSRSIIAIISAGERITFAAAFVLIYLALYAKFKVEIDSSKCTICLEAVQMRVVFEFPPRASLSNLVSIELRNGICFFLSTRALMHSPRKDKLWLILVPSLRV